ncbi:MAG: zinc ribbon domain-containing protein [Clostridiales bacterium]|jgi:predicted nucleic acid-binding Zn ribbon protein|nr:zinc ribbon domain-containing protein [Clostridiales bacterium]
MALFDNIGKRLASTTQNVVRNTKDITDIARLSSLISDDEKQAESLRQQIGKLYFETAEYDPETLIGKLCLALAAATDRIEKHQNEILVIKGVKKCPYCGTEISQSAAFCGYCGERLDFAAPTSDPSAQTRRYCSYCRADITNDTIFCSSCGKKI